MIEIFLVRHAESEGNIAPQYIGGRSNHLQITDLGKQQAQCLAEYFARLGIRFDKIGCSTAVRTQQTLAPICAALSVPLDRVVFSDELLELEQGEWVGLLRDEVYTPQMKQIIAQTDGHFKAPGGESQREVEERMWRWLQREVLDVYAPAAKAKVLVVSHGVAIRCTLRRVLESNPNMTHKIRTDNTSITKISWNADDGWFLNCVNDTKHLLAIGN